MSQPVFDAQADRLLLPAGRAATRHVLVRVVAPVRAGQERLPLNLAFVLDRSGSMSGGKLGLAQDSALAALDSLQPCDRFAVVLYNHEVELRLPSAPVTREARAAARAALSTARASGNTDLFAGWLRGCEQVAAQLGGKGLARCLLLTDGLANTGVTDPQAIVREVEELARRGVGTTVFGVGDDFDEQLLAAMSRAGQGSFHYVQEQAQIERYVRAEVGQALETVATEVRLVAEVPPGVTVELLHACEAVPVPGGTAWRLGALASGEELRLALRLAFPADGAEAELRLTLLDREGALGGPVAGLAFARATSERVQAAGLDPAPLRLAAEGLAARARRGATALNRERLYEQARLDLRRAALAVRDLAPGDGPLEALAGQLEAEAEEYSREMESFDLKRRLMNSTRAELGRTRSRRGRAAPHAPLALATCDEAFGHLLQSVYWALSAAQPLLGPARFDGFGRSARQPHWLSPRFEPDPARPLAPEDEAELVRDLSRANPDAAVVLVFVHQQLADNWFSHWHDEAGTAVISSFGWERTAGVPLAAFLAFELLHHGLRRLGPSYQPEDWAHLETRGCLFDFCRLKPEIEIKLQTAALCDDCWVRLLQAGLPMEQLEPLLDVVRELAHAAPGLPAPPLAAQP